MELFTDIATVITWVIFILLLLILGGGTAYRIWWDIINEKD